MANITDETANSVFYKTRIAASRNNEQLSSREGAADILSIDRGRLYRIEKGVADPYPEEVHLMADLYNAPELRNYYCTEMCPLGECIAKADVTNLDRITIMAMSSFEKTEETKQKLLKIVADGVVSDDEKTEMLAVVQNLGELEGVAQNLKNWVKKNLREVK